MKIETFIAVASFALGIGATLWSVVQYYTSSVQKRYAAERDFQHLRRNQEQLLEAVRQVQSELDDLSDELRNLARVAQILLAKQGDSVSALLGYRKKDE